MFLISKLLNYFLLPPGVFVIQIVGGVILLKFKKFKIAKCILIITAVIIYLISIKPVSDLMIKPLESAYSPMTLTKDIEADYIVIMGGGTFAASPEYKRDILIDDALRRTMYGAYLYKELNIPIITTGGTVLKKQEERTEAQIAKEQLEQLGILSNDIYKEDISMTTYENAVNVQKLYNPKKVIIVTSAYHMLRSSSCFEKIGIETIKAPTDYKVEQVNYGIYTLFPNIQYMMNTYKALHEYIGIIFYNIKY